MSENTFDHLPVKGADVLYYVNILNVVYHQSLESHLF